MSFVAPSVLSVLELFKGPLAGMRFADVDAEGLAALIASVDAAGVEVSDAEAKVGELQQALAVQQEALLALAQRALAYARVFAESDDQLSSELNGISLPRSGKPRKASAPKSSDVPSVAGSLQAQSDAASADAELAPGTASLEGRAVELDADTSGASLVPALASTRKSRRTRGAVSDGQADPEARVSASE